VDILPDLSPCAPTEPEAIGATGTDGQPIGKLFAHYLPTAGDGIGHFESEAGGLPLSEADGRNPLDSRVLSLTDGARRKEAPPGFEPGMEVLQTSALPLGDGAGGESVMVSATARPRNIRFVAGRGS
jgi:hypothetical protein